MGFFSKFIPKEIRKPINKVLKPVQKLSDKLIPNEVRPFLPLLTAALPYTNLLGPMGGLGGFAKMYGTNILSQAMADPEAEFEDLNQLSAFLSGTQGGLMGTETANNLRGMTTRGQFSGVPDAITGGDAALKDALANRSFLTKAKDLGISGLAEASEYLGGQKETLGKLFGGEEINIAEAGKDAVMRDLFTGAGAKAAAKGIAVPASLAMGDVTEAYARPMMREFEKADAAERAEYETNMDERNKEQADMTMLFMRQAGHDEQTIEDTLALDGLESYYSAPTESAAQGGIIGLKGGGIPDDEFMELVSKLREDGFSQEEAIEEAIRQLSENMAQGGIIGLKEGGMLNFGGREMDLRTGGFVPIGKKERADDVPARLSKNEFVMTADAVRAAGGGSVNKGAQRMYDVMNKLEARA